MALDKNKTLIERNQGIIDRCLSELYAGDRSYYIDNETKDCISEIAKVEGRSDLIPKYREWLSQWQTRSDVSRDWLELKDYIKEKFQKHHKELLQKQKVQEEQLGREEKERQDKEGQKFFEKNKDLINKFLEITERKVSIIDDYGDENWNALSEEINACVTKIAKRSGVSDGDIKDFFKKDYTWKLGEEYGWLREKLDKVFREYHKVQKEKPANSTELKNLSGVEFEVWISKLLKENGFDDVRGTPATGDQGADLIAKKDGKIIIIQAKRYQGSVGNKAVQEVIGAVQFYRGDEGWVITNSTFTPSAKALAQRSDVKLIDGKMLESPEKYLH
ncbi:MAG: restriction endonuclease [Parcubacteria group bacterium]|nr:restriction endonuclease [Parcubacteria group bacterium]